MSSVTDGEPGPEDSRLTESRSGRGRGRRGMLWRRHDEDVPAVGELDADDIQELLRRSNTSVPLEVEVDEPTAVAEEAPYDDIASRVGSRTGALPDPGDVDDVDWGSMVEPHTPDDLDSVDSDDAPGSDRFGPGPSTDWASVIDRSLGRPLTEIEPHEFEAGSSAATDDPSLRGTLTDRLQRMRSESVEEPEDVAAEETEDDGTGAEADDAAEQEEQSQSGDWSAIIARATERPFGDAHGVTEPAAEDEPVVEPESGPVAESEPVDPLTAEVWVEEGDAAPEPEPVAEVEPVVEPEPEPEPVVEAAPVAEQAIPDHRLTDEEAGQRVIAAAVDGGFAEPTPVPQPKGLARLRRRQGAGSAPRPQARPLQEVVEPPLLEEPIPNIDRTDDVPRRPEEVLAHARAEIEAELVAPVETTDGAEATEVAVPDNAEVVAALAARLRRDAELAAAEQAAERLAAEEAARLAHEARAEADRLANAASAQREEAELRAVEHARLAAFAHEAREAAEARARVMAEAGGVRG
ncbi:hypothetical protein ACFFOS_10360, partial [Nocardioides kongjuensis]|uniref:hypothetical protein n=1 Tax=Nocardioides kongjuensis TaxID=349522 RepID=UPI0035EF14FF